MNLAEKYRPTRLEDLAGQDTAVAQVRDMEMIRATKGQAAAQRRALLEANKAELAASVAKLK